MLNLDGRKLRQVREAAGVSVEEIALATHRTVGSVFKWEANRAHPPVIVVRALADFLGVAYADLCDDRYTTPEAAEEAKRSLDEYVAGVVRRAGDLTPDQRVRLAQLFPAPSTLTNGARRAVAA